MSKRNPDLVTIGVILGAHGVRGDVRVKSFTAEPEAVFEYAPLLSEQGEGLIEPMAVRSGKDHFIVSPKNTHAPSAAMRKSEVAM